MTRFARKSIRLKGYDYSQPSSYFITMCTKDRACILGEIIDGRMLLSEVGKIAERCWRDIPAHFRQTRVDAFQVMPNHLHGIIEIRAPVGTPVGTTGTPVGTRHVSQLGFAGEKFGKPRPGSLSTIVRSFKAAVTKEAREKGLFPDKPLWQSRFYDRIIRDDVGRFFVRQYIELNPLMWYLDSDNADAHRTSINELRKTLHEKYHLDGNILERVIEHEVTYRDWVEAEQESRSDCSQL